MNTPIKWKSCAVWPAGTFDTLNNRTHDTHDTEVQASGVARRLRMEGAGGDGLSFPLATWVEPVFEADIPLRCDQLDSAKLYDNLTAIFDYDDKLAKMTSKELVLEVLGSRAADYRCVNELMNRVLPNFTEVITDEETEAATTPSPERSQPLSLSEKKPECCTASEWYEIQASAEHAAEPVDVSHLANTLAPYIKFSLFEPVPGEAHPFTAMSIEQIACLIQKNIDELMLPLRDELEQSHSVVMATRQASIDAMNRIRALCGKGPNDPLRAEDYLKEMVDQLTAATKERDAWKEQAEGYSVLLSAACDNMEEVKKALGDFRTDPASYMPHNMGQTVQDLFSKYRAEQAIALHYLQQQEELKNQLRDEMANSKRLLARNVLLSESANK